MPVMVKERSGFHNLGLQIPDVLWKKICEEAERRGVSAARVLTEILQKNYRVSVDKMPTMRRPGRPPKQK